MILAGDIGGTKTVLAIYAAQGIHAPLAVKTFTSGNHKNLEEIIEEFLITFNFPVTRAAFGVAGPVSLGKAAITNLPWIIEEERLREKLDTHAVKLLNDLEAIAWSIPTLTSKDICPLNTDGTARPGGTIAVLAPGTGLGEAYLIQDGGRYRACPSEGGHADFAPTNALEVDLLCYLMQKYSHVSYERVCSGIGIPHIYDFLRASGREVEPTWLRQKLDAVADPTPVIINAATGKERSCKICTSTLDICVALLGSEAGNMALKFLPSGGVYIGGGIPPRILNTLKNGRLLTRFFDKGRLSNILKPVPVNIILKPDTALTGAAYYAMEFLRT